MTIYLQPCVLRRGRAQRDETQSGTEERECCAGEVVVLTLAFFSFSGFPGCVTGRVDDLWMCVIASLRFS